MIGLAGRDRAITAANAGGEIVGFSLIGVLAVAAAWEVESSLRWEKLVRIITWPAILVAAGLVVLAGTGQVGRGIAVWSGPWGWAVQPWSGAPSADWLAALLGLACAAELAAIITLRRCGAAPTERHLRRAEGRAGLVASLASFDIRTARRSLVRVTPRRDPGELRYLRDLFAGLSRIERGAWHHGDLAVVWRDVMAAMSAPRYPLQAALLGGGGTALSLLNAPNHPGAVVAGALLTYVGAARMLEPARAELDVPSRPRVFLGLPPGRARQAHAIFPSLLLTGAAITCCAGLSARRGGRMPDQVLFTAAATDPSGGGGFLLAWLLVWPATAAAAGAGPLLVATRADTVAGTIAIVFAVALAVLFARWLRRERPDTLMT